MPYRVQNEMRVANFVRFPLSVSACPSARQPPRLARSLIGTDARVGVARLAEARAARAETHMFGPAQGETDSFNVHAQAAEQKEGRDGRAGDKSCANLSTNTNARFQRPSSRFGGRSDKPSLVMCADGLNKAFSVCQSDACVSVASHRCKA
jgi:hypothetical protein